MRRLLAVVAAVGLTPGAWGATTTTTTAGGGPGAKACAKGNLNLLTPGKLTVGTDNPVFQPWFAGAKGSGKPPWKADPNNGTGNPYTGQGYEASVAYDVAEKLGFTH